MQASTYSARHSDAGKWQIGSHTSNKPIGKSNKNREKTNTANNASSKQSESKKDNFTSRTVKLSATSSKTMMKYNVK